MAAEALEKSVLESKDKEQLLAIAQALGIKTTSRAAKATLIDKILESTGATPSAPSAAPAPASDASSEPSTPAASDVPDVVLGPDGEPLADWEVDLLRAGELPLAEPSTTTATTATARTAAHAASGGPRSGISAPRPSVPQRDAARLDDDDADGDGDDSGDDGSDADGDASGADGESRNSRRRRRRRNKNRGDGDVPGDGVQSPQSGDGQRTAAPAATAPNGGAPRTTQRDPGRDGRDGRDGREPQRDRPSGRNERDDSIDVGNLDPVEIAGHLDLRDEGYGFLRVNGHLAHRDDAYIPVKLTRQFGLRKGDHVTGLSRPAGRNEKNPAMLEIHTINGRDPELAHDRPRFELLTPELPNQRLRLEPAGRPTDPTARITDLIAPIGKGQRGLVVAPPNTGATTFLTAIAASIAHHHPEVVLVVLALDARPEEVTELRRVVQGEVVASTFERSGDEHVAVAELTIDKAKRQVEMGADVVILVDGITQLGRAHHLAAPASGRAGAGGVDVAALLPTKQFFAAARNTTEAGSLTIIAVGLVDTHSRLDEAILGELRGGANWELRLDRRLADEQVHPAIDVTASGNRRADALLDAAELAALRARRAEITTGDDDRAPIVRLLERR